MNDSLGVATLEKEFLARRLADEREKNCGDRYRRNFGIDCDRLFSFGAITRPARRNDTCAISRDDSQFNPYLLRPFFEEPKLMPQISLAGLIQKAIANQVVSFPTDTGPALAARPDQAALIFATKQRSADKPLILMAAHCEDLWEYVEGTPPERKIWQKIAQTYFPGALTLVLPASDRVPPAMNPLDPTTIGVRIPAHGTARQILAQTGCLATTSANLSGELPLEEMTAIAATFPGVWVLKTTDLSPQEQRGSGLPSTVAKWTGEGWHILRQGSIKLETISSI